MRLRVVGVGVGGYGGLEARVGILALMAGDLGEFKPMNAHLRDRLPKETRH